MALRHNASPNCGRGGRRKQTGFWQRQWSVLSRKQASRRLSKKSPRPKAITHRPWRFSLASLRIPAFLCILAFAGWGLFHLVCHWNIFRVTELRLEGAKTVTERQVLTLAGLRQGDNLVTLDSREAERKIAAHPWVAEVQIRKKWPSGVLVQVQEYVPFAMVNLVSASGEARLCYIDESGHLVADVPDGGTLDYPVINGLGPEDVRDGSLVQEGGAAYALQLLRLAAQGNAFLPLRSVSEVRVDEKKACVLYLADHPFPIHFGKEKLAYKFNELLRVLQKLYASGEINQVAALEMDYGEDLNKMLCRWVQTK